MATLPVLDGGLSSCCLDTLARYTATERDGTTLSCEDCRKVMHVKKQRWMWKPVDSTGLDTSLGGDVGRHGGSVPGPRRDGRRINIRPYPKPNRPF